MNIEHPVHKALQCSTPPPGGLRMNIVHPVPTGPTATSSKPIPRIHLPRVHGIYYTYYAHFHYFIHLWIINQHNVLLIFTEPYFSTLNIKPACLSNKVKWHTTLAQRHIMATATLSFQCCFGLFPLNLWYSIIIKLKIAFFNEWR